jgi:NIMA (never in mitosis gene a)-related kinase 1/4/5
MQIKMGRLPRKARENSLNEVRFLASFDSPYITKYHEAFFDQDLDVLCIVMEYAAEGDLRKKITNYQKERRLITEVEIWKAMLHVLHGLRALHDQKILHRDIKCENILLSDGRYKIGDMNVSKLNKEGFVDTQTGTPYYASPEVWKDEPYN